MSGDGLLLLYILILRFARLEFTPNALKFISSFMSTTHVLADDICRRLYTLCRLVNGEAGEESGVGERTTVFGMSLYNIVMNIEPYSSSVLPVWWLSVAP